MLGLSGLVRSEALIFLAFLLLPIAWLQSRESRVRDVAELLLGVALVVLPWTVRNAVMLDAFVPIAHSYKGVLLGANCADSYLEAYRGTWSFRCIKALDVKGLSEVEIFDRARDEGLRYAFDHVSQWPAVVGARVLRTWGLFRPGSWFGYGWIEVRDVDFHRNTRAFGWSLLVLAPFGLVPLLRRDPVRAGLLFAPILIVTFTSAIGYGNPRFRAAAEPSLAILAAMAICGFWNQFRGGRSETRVDESDSGAAAS